MSKRSSQNDARLFEHSTFTLFCDRLNRFTLREQFGMNKRQLAPSSSVPLSPVQDSPIDEMPSISNLPVHALPLPLIFSIPPRLMD